MIQVSERRRKTQGGQEIMEFAGTAFLLVPMLLGGFVTGMGLIRSIQVNHVCRDITNIYVHGADFTSYSYQQLAQRLSTGLNLQIGSSYTGNDRNNSDNAGDMLVLLSEIEWVGATTDPQCVAVAPSSCNSNSFVFQQRIKFGNGTLQAQSPDTAGDPSTTNISNTGVVSSPVKDSLAKLSTAKQTAMQALWQTTANGRTPLKDGQIVYMVEVYVQTPGFATGSFGGGAQYARYFF